MKQEHITTSRRNKIEAKAYRSQCNREKTHQLAKGRLNKGATLFLHCRVGLATIDFSN